MKIDRYDPNLNWATHVLQYFLQKDAIMKIGANL